MLKFRSNIVSSYC